MRPLRLEIEGLTAFRERQVVPFEDFDLFAITGPTGAGKTTILDALTLALYGLVPRTTGVRGSLSDLVSHGLAEARVLLEFGVDGERYRVTRRLPRNTSQSARVERLDDGEWIDDLEGSGVKAANARLVELIKLDFPSFTKAVLLPQGEFHRFLKGEPKERRDTLVALLGLENYLKVGELARRRAATKRTGVERTREILEEQFADATTEALANLKTEAKEAVAQARTLKDAADDAAGHLASSKAAEGLHARLRTEAIELGELADGITAERERCSDLEAQERKELAAFKSADKGVKEIRDKLARARAARDRVVEQYASLEGLAELRGLAQSRADALDRAIAAKSKIEEATEAAKARRAQVTELEKLCEAAEEKRSAEGESLAKARPAHEKANQRTEQLKRSLETADKSARDLHTAQKALAKAKTSAESTERKEGGARDKLERTCAQLEELRAKHAAAALAEGLAPGDACPVCERPLEKQPHHHEELKDLEAVTEEHQRLEESARSAADDRAAAASTLSGSEAALEAAEIALKESLGGHSAIESLRGAVKQAASEAAVADKQLEKASQVAELATSEAYEARERLITARTELEGLEGQVEIHTATLKGARSEGELAETKLRKHFGRRFPSDPLATLEGQREKVDEAESLLDRTQAELDDSQEKRRSAEEGRDKATAAVRELDLDLARIKGEANAASEGLVATLEDGSVKVSVKELSIVGEGRITLIDGLVGWLKDLTGAAEKGVTAAQRDQDRWEKKVTVLAATHKVDDGDAAGAAATLRILAEEAAEGRVRAAAAVEATKQQIQKRRELETGIEDDVAETVLLDALAAELRADRFVRFILDEMLDLLAEHASAELLRISDGRYSLVASDGEFEVIDHANADERRSVRTLSGGETFLASLSLALALSKQVSELAGEGLGASLEAVFIDEGFGSLDPETLEDVIDALERLRDEDLSVGVISHVPELAERIQTGLAVKKDGNKSEIQVVGA